MVTVRSKEPSPGKDDFCSVGYVAPGNTAKVSDAYKTRAVLALQHGIRLYFITCSQKSRDLLSKTDSTLARFWNGDSLEEVTIPRPLACYDRSGPHVSRTKKRILQIFSERGTRFVNDRAFREGMGDKWVQYEHLFNTAIPTPKTALFSLETLRLFLREKRTVFIKPRVASQGRGQLVIQRKQGKFLIITSGGKKEISFGTKKELIQELQSRIPNPQKYILQEGVDVDRLNGRVYDFRVVCQRAKSGKMRITACYMRVGPAKSHQANIGQAGHPQDPSLVVQNWGELYKKISEVCHQIFKTLYDLGEAGIDLVLTKKQELVCIEINTRPGGKGFQLMREWVTDDPHLSRRGVYPYSYSNAVRKRWGRYYTNYRLRPLLYCKFLTETRGDA
jgi:glutathione synthase/RimK-type ligase-like ATP-grasp enzyme